MLGKNLNNLIIEHGDIYIMSEKAVGNDWLNSNIPTLRHAAGAEKYTSLKNKLLIYFYLKQFIFIYFIILKIIDIIYLLALIFKFIVVIKYW